MVRFFYKAKVEGKTFSEVEADSEAGALSQITGESVGWEAFRNPPGGGVHFRRVRDDERAFVWEARREWSYDD